MNVGTVEVWGRYYPCWSGIYGEIIGWTITPSAITH